MTTRAIAYPPFWRVTAALLVAISRASLPVLLALLVFSHNPPIWPEMLMRAFTILVIAPGLAAWLIERASAVTVDVGGGELVLRARAWRVEVPCAAIARIVPWRIPLPGSGLSFRLRSGRRLGYGVQLPDPTTLVAALVAAGVTDETGAAEHPSARYAHAKHDGPPRRWYHPFGKFVVFGLVPTLPLFRAHQWIAYGGTWGQWYLLGPRAYLQTFAFYWTTLIIYLILYAGFLRGIAEGVALATAWVAPSRAARVRRAMEVLHRVLYYGGVPVFLIIRFLPW